MATMRLVPSTIYNAASSYLTISNASNAYTNTDSTTYATITNTNASTSSRYVYVRGFNFSSIPSDAEVSSFTVKIKGYYVSGSAQTLYLCNGTTTQSGATATAFGTSNATRTFSNGSLTWDTISSWGSNFGIRVNCRRGSRNTQATYYIYGAEIEVTYTIPVYHTVTSSTTTGTISPSGSTSILEGEDYVLTISASNPVVTDNNIDVTSQLERNTGGTDTYVPNDSESSGFTISNISNAYSDISDSSSADCSLAARTTGNLYLDIDVTGIPSSATIQSVTCQASLQVSRNGSSSSMTSSCQLYSGNTAKGSSTTIVSSATDVSRTTFTLTPGTWTASEIQNARLYITMYNGASSTVRHLYVYGVSFTVTYTVSGEVYTYTITNVTADHTIVVSAGMSTDKIYFKSNGSWVTATKAYKKVSGSWVEQTNLTQVFDPTKNYVKG